MIRQTLIAFATACLFAGAAAATPALKKIPEIKSKPSIFKAASKAKPLVIKTRAGALAHFDKEQVAALLKQVDLTKQKLVVFAWRGSGQDRIDVQIAESFPEQVTFTHIPGRSRDLRPHVAIYALRSNVTWRVARR